MFEHDFPFDPTHGFDEARVRPLGAPDAPPPDFEAFWSSTFRAQARVDPDPVETGVHRTEAGMRVSTIHYRHLGAGDTVRRSGGWLLWTQTCLRWGRT